MKTAMNKGQELDQIIEVYRDMHTLSEFHCQRRKEGAFDIKAVFSLYGYDNTCTCTYDQEMKQIEASCDCAWSKDYQQCPHMHLVHAYFKEYQAQMKENETLDYTNAHHLQFKEEIEHYEERRANRGLRQQAQKSREMLEQLRSRYEMGIMQDVTQTRYQMEPRLQL